MKKIQYWTENLKIKWINNFDDPEAIDWANRFGIHLANKNDKKKYYEKNKVLSQKGRNSNRVPLTTNQLRKFFGEVKRLQMKEFNLMDIKMLKPKLAYAVARTKDRNAKIHDFYEQLVYVIDAIDDEPKFNNFVKIFEAIVAFHKAAEDSDLILETTNK